MQGGAVLPPGSWLFSSRNPRVQDDTLHTSLQRIDGTWAQARARIKPHAAFNNENGSLVEVQPPEAHPVPLRIFQTHSAPTAHMRTWKARNPRHAYAFFDDDMCMKFMEKHMEPEVVRAYRRLAPGAARADLWRYCVLYVHGGVYIDADCVCLVPLEQWLPREKCVAVVDHTFGPTVRLFQAFLACTPQHPLMRRAIDCVVRNVQHGKFAQNIFELTGPTLLGRCLNELHGHAADHRWSTKDPPPETALLVHRRFRDDSILHNRHKVVQCQLHIPRSVPNHRNQRTYLLPG